MPRAPPVTTQVPPRVMARRGSAAAGSGDGPDDAPSWPVPTDLDFGTIGCQLSADGLGRGFRGRVGRHIDHLDPQLAFRPTAGLDPQRLQQPGEHSAFRGCDRLRAAEVASQVRGGHKGTARPIRHGQQQLIPSLDDQIG